MLKFVEFYQVKLVELFSYQIIYLLYKLDLSNNYLGLSSGQ